MKSSSVFGLAMRRTLSMVILSPSIWADCPGESTGTAVGVGVAAGAPAPHASVSVPATPRNCGQKQKGPARIDGGPHSGPGASAAGAPP